MIQSNLRAVIFVFCIGLLTSFNVHSVERNMSAGNTSEGCPTNWDPNDARLPTGNCPKPKKTIKYDPDCARLYGCSDQNNNQGSNNLSAGERDKKPIKLLVPAVQKVH